MKAGSRPPAPPPERPIPHKKKAAAAAVGAAAYMLMNKDQDKKQSGDGNTSSGTTTTEPADNWGKKDYETEKTPAAPSASPGGQVGGSGNDVSAATKPGAQSKDNVGPAGSIGNDTGTGTSTPQGSGTGSAADTDGFYWSNRMRNIKESQMNLYTKHPVTGQKIKINVDSLTLESLSQKYSSQHRCGTERVAVTESWRSHAWSSTPISKILKGKE
jgi:hypothetical protein